MTFALCYRKTGSLWFPIGFHSAWLFFLDSAWSLPVTGAQPFRLLDVSAGPSNLLSGGAFGSEGSLLLTPLLGFLVYLLAALPDHPQALLDLALSSEALVTEPLGESAEPEESEEERGPNRFKSSMRPASLVPEMDPALFRTAPSPHAARTVFIPGQADQTVLGGDGTIASVSDGEGTSVETPSIAVPSTYDIGDRIGVHTGVPVEPANESDGPEGAPIAELRPLKTVAVAVAAAATAEADKQVPRPKPKAPRW